jgi:hypothetical protein
MAEPRPDAGGNGREPEVDAVLEAANVPASTNVIMPNYHVRRFFDVSKYQDPLHSLLQYIAEVSLFHCWFRTNIRQ